MSYLMVNGMPPGGRQYAHLSVENTRQPQTDHSQFDVRARLRYLHRSLRLIVATILHGDFEDAAGHANGQVAIYNRIRNLEGEIAVLRADNDFLQQELLKLRQETMPGYTFP